MTSPETYNAPFIHVFLSGFRPRGKKYEFLNGIARGGCSYLCVFSASRNITLVSALAGAIVRVRNSEMYFVVAESESVMLIALPC